MSCHPHPCGQEWGSHPEVVRTAVQVRRFRSTVSVDGRVGGPGRQVGGLAAADYCNVIRGSPPTRPVPEIEQVPPRGLPPFHACRTQLRVAICAQ